jgi:hypothetical protein
VITFEFHPLRFEFQALDRITFRRDKAANSLRGAFGAALRRIACTPPCSDPKTCDRAGTCAYARVFSPTARIPGPSGFLDSPRPFVFRVRELDGINVEPGATFAIGIHLFDCRDAAAEPLIRAFGDMAEQGFGPHRARARLTGVQRLDLAGQPDAALFDPESGSVGPLPRPACLNLEPGLQNAMGVRVEFLTPTELKTGNGLAQRPEFDVLVARIRDRLSTLRTIYGAGPLGLDFKGLASRAASVRMTQCRIDRCGVFRRSARTGQTHPLGGFTGYAEYEGKAGEFVPYLEAAQWTGVGRQTVWGKGELRCRVL